MNPPQRAGASSTHSKRWRAQSVWSVSGLPALSVHGFNARNLLSGKCLLGPLPTRSSRDRKKPEAGFQLVEIPIAMTRLEELTLKLADEMLTDAESRELESLLAAEPEAAAVQRQLLEIEAALRGQRETLDLAGPTLARLRSLLAQSVERRVMQQLEVEPPPDWAELRSRRREEADRTFFLRLKSASSALQYLRTWSRAAKILARTIFPLPARKERGEGQGEGRPKNRISSPRPSPPSSVGRRGSVPVAASAALRLRPRLNRPAVLALAVSVVLLLSLSVRFFSPTMGQPVLAEVNGVDVSIKRGKESVAAANGTVLQSADVLRIGTNAAATIAFGAERTRLELSAGTELKLASLVHSKRFALTSGKIEASVARQRPFQPMLIATPQAEARVLGTKFSLLTTPNATRLEVTEGKVRFTRASDSAHVQVGAGNYAVAASSYELCAQPLTGSILREYWTNLPGEHYVPFLTSHRDFPDRPSGHDYLKRFESPSHWGTNYGARLCGYLHPPKTGAYTFWIAAGDGAEFSLSRDDNPDNKQQIAYAKRTAPHEWTNHQGQQSSSINLVAGRKYYVEVLQKQGVETEDHLAVAWQGPGREREVIPGEFLSPLKPRTNEEKQ